MMVFGSRKVEVPLCETCARQRLSARVAWIAGGLVGAVIAVIVSAMLLEVLLPFPDDEGARRMMGMVVALLLLAIAGVVTTLTIKSALLRHRLAWDPVYVGDVSVHELAFRNAADARDVLAASIGEAAPTGYRDPAEAVAPYVPKGDPLGWMIPAVLGVGAAVGFVVRWIDLSSGKEITVAAVEGVVFDIGGKWALLGFWVVTTVFFLALAAGLRSGRRAAGRASG